MPTEAPGVALTSNETVAVEAQMAGLHAERDFAREALANATQEQAALKAELKDLLMAYSAKYHGPPPGLPDEGLMPAGGNETAPLPAAPVPAVSNATNAT